MKGDRRDAGATGSRFGRGTCVGGCCRAEPYTAGMRMTQVLVAVGLVLVLGVPFVLRPRASGEAGARGVPTLVVMTPHVPQIRAEFAAGFSRWHERVHGGPAAIDWRVPGGTSEIIKQLEAQYIAAAKDGRVDFSDASNPRMAAGTIACDLVLGGGSFDHGRLKQGVTLRRIVVTGDGRAASEVRLPMSEPAGFPAEQLRAWYGEDNHIGAQSLYDPEQYWLGTALSGFGIVYNREVLSRLGLPEPTRFTDLTGSGYFGQIVLADPRQSGSVATTLDSILNWSLYERAAAGGWEQELNAALLRGGWEKAILPSHGREVEAAFERGWRILREMTANARSFTNSSTKPPIDVSAGEAAAGLAIDFYGRGQAQAVLAPGQEAGTGRVGYVDPAGTVYIDADPVSVLRGGPDPALARRFIEFCLTEEGQALWQFRAVETGAGAGNPKGEDGRAMGPARDELRRMPVRRVMYEKYAGAMIDPVNPFEIASQTLPAGWRTAIAPMMGAFAIDTAHEQRAAWAALRAARGDAGFPRERLEEMERLFYAWPATPVEGKELGFTAANMAAIKAEWRKPGVLARLTIGYTRFFERNYRRVVELGPR